MFPGAWTAVMLSLDSPGFWNVRTENLDTWYLGQETYIRVVDPDGGYNVTEMVAPETCSTVASSGISRSMLFGHTQL